MANDIQKSEAKQATQYENQRQLSAEDVAALEKVRVQRVRKQADEDLADAEIMIESSQDVLLEQLDAIDEKAADAEAWEDGEFDLWKPTKEGEAFVGIYLKMLHGVRFKVHVFAARSEKDPKKVVTKRINGSSILTRELKKFGEGSTVKVTFIGKQPNSSGDGSLNLFRVQKLKVGAAIS